MHVSACAIVPDSVYVICALFLFKCACASVCLFVCVFVHALVCMSVRMHSLRISFASAVYVCFGVYLHLCVCRYVCVSYVRVCMYVRMSCMYISMDLRMQCFACVHLHTHASLHVCGSVCLLHTPANLGKRERISIHVHA